MEPILLQPVMVLLNARQKLEVARGAIERAIRGEIRVRHRGHPIVVAFLFAHPDSDAMRLIDARGEYFDARTGDTWDLLFPGYYKPRRGCEFEQDAGARPAGHGFAGKWYFSPAGFNDLREYVQRSSERRWEYSGGTDLVLVNAWVPDQGEPMIDWSSTISGQVTDQQAGIRTLTLANVIERITRDLENEIEDASYGVSEVTDGPPSPKGHVTRDFMINALAGIAAALGARALGT